MANPDEVITSVIQCELSGMEFPSLDYSTQELMDASRRAGLRDLSNVMHALDLVIAGRLDR